jgi:hypothetical protein
MLGHLLIYFVLPITPIPESPRPDFHTEHPFVEFGSPRCSWTRTSYLILEGMPPDLKIASHNVINDVSELSAVDLPYTSKQSEHPFQFSLFSTNDNLMDLNGPTRFPILHRDSYRPNGNNVWIAEVIQRPFIPLHCAKADQVQFPSSSFPHVSREPNLVHRAG